MEILEYIFIFWLISFIIAEFLEFIGFAKIGDPRNWFSVPESFLRLSCGLVGFLQPYEAFWEFEKPKKDHTTRNKVLFVANHQLSAFDIPLVMSITFLETKIFTRAIADSLHFKIPIWKTLGWIMGAFEGSRQSCDQAMQAGYPIIVFPGGSNEVWRPSHLPSYSLQWGSRKGFAEMAIKHGYTIIPVSCIGMEDMVKTVFDVPGYLFFQCMGDTKRAKQGDTIPFILPSLKFQTQYFYFGKSITTVGLDSKILDDVLSLRDQCKSAIEDGIQKLFRMRDKDPNRYLNFKDYFMGKRHYLKDMVGFDLRQFDIDLSKDDEEVSERTKLEE